MNASGADADSLRQITLGHFWVLLEQAQNAEAYSLPYCFCWPAKSQAGLQLPHKDCQWRLGVGFEILGDQAGGGVPPEFLQRQHRQIAVEQKKPAVCGSGLLTDSGSISEVLKSITQRCTCPVTPLYLSIGSDVR